MTENEDPVITQVEFYHNVLLPLQDDLDHKVRARERQTHRYKNGKFYAVPFQGNTPRGTGYLISMLLEYIRSLHEHGVKVHHSFYCAVVSTLSQSQPPCYYQCVDQRSPVSCYYQCVD